MSTIEIFISYSHKDEALREELEKQMSLLKWQGLIGAWHDRRIGAGQEWESLIDERLDSAKIILLLISPDFMASNYCYGVEVKRAMERHEAGQALVVPIILRPSDWQSAFFGKLQALPKNGQPVTSSSNRDKAFLDIAQGIRKAIEGLNKQTFITSEDINRKAISQHVLKYPDVAKCPYRGLFAFQEEDEPFFFGRETFTQQLVNTVYQKPFVAVIGSSGSGKSSSVFAGLIPHLRREGSWLITSLRPSDRPFHSLALALMSLLEPQMSARERLLESNELAQQLQESKITLRDIVELITQKQFGRRFLVVIDQFEELYTLCREAEVREHFLDELAFIVQTALKDNFLNLSVLLTLRADFLGQALDHHRPFADALQSSNLLLPPMNVQELQDTIRKPAEALNVEIEEGLTERILQEVKPANNRLPLLEFALTLLWNKQKGGRLTHAGYVEIGGVEKALTDHAEQVFAELSEDEQIQAQRVFMQLVHFGEGTEDTRRLATHSEIGEENWKLVIHLSSARARLVVIGRDQISGEETVEMVHEALISGWHRLRDWIENNREFRTWQERLRAAMRQWEKSNRDDGALLRGFLLTEAISWMAKYGEILSQTERTFIDCSQQQELRQKLRDKELLRELNLRSVLTREMSFRVKNNLATVAAILSLQRRRTRSAEVRNILAESVNRIQGMASAHDLLSREDTATARVDDIARKVVGVANANLRPLDTQIEFEVTPCAVVIPPRAVTILALVLNEMVSNAIKHGMTGMREGAVTISGREEDGLVIVEVLDTGNGPPVSEPLEEDDSEGLGLSLIRNLMGDIGGEFTLQRTMELPPRTCAEVRFPLP